MNIHLLEDRACYIAIEKVACSSIKYALGHHYGIASRKMPHVWPWRKLTPDRLLELRDEGVWAFAFIRNPFDRLVSCWAHKVARYRGKRARCPLFRDLPTSTGFIDFVAWATAQDPRRCNWHFRPQHRFLEHQGRPLTDCLYYFESLSGDWRMLQARFGWPDLPHRNATPHPHYRELFTAQTRDMAERYYARDLEIGGYEF